MKNELPDVLTLMLEKLPGVLVGKKFNSVNVTVRKKGLRFHKGRRCCIEAPARDGEGACRSQNRVLAGHGKTQDEGMGGDSLQGPC